MNVWLLELHLVCVCVRGNLGLTTLTTDISAIGMTVLESGGSQSVIITALESGGSQSVIVTVLELH